MKNFIKKKQFVQMRGKGISMRKISEELKIPLRTLYDWSKEFTFEIQFLKSVEREAFIESLNFHNSGRLNILFNELKKIDSAITRKEYEMQSLNLLMKWKFSIISQISEILKTENIPDPQNIQLDRSLLKP